MSQNQKKPGEEGQSSKRESILEIKNLKKYYQNSGGLLSRFRQRKKRIKAVDNVNLKLKRGETLGIIGESGSGKSTLIETLLRLEEPTSGTIRFGNNYITSLSGSELRKFRENAQIIFQDPYETLNPRKTIYQAVSEPVRNFRDLSYEELHQVVIDTLESVGLRPATRYLDSYPRQLSGGQRQRVNIARAVVLKPDLLVADEPVSMLDVSLQSGVIKMMNNLQEEIGFSMIYVSHNIPVVNLVADRIGLMYRGRIVEQGEADEIVNHPKHPYTKALIDSLPDLEKGRERVRLPLQETSDFELPSGCRFHPRCPDAMEHCSDRTPELTESEGRDIACFLYHDSEVNND